VKSVWEFVDFELYSILSFGVRKRLRRKAFSWPVANLNLTILMSGRIRNRKNDAC